MHNSSFLVNTYKVPSSTLRPASDMALQERQTSVEEGPDASSKRHQPVGHPGAPRERYLEVGVNHARAGGKTLLVVSLVVHATPWNHSKEQSG